jgi:uncharacterized protein YrrD
MDDIRIDNRVFCGADEVGRVAKVIADANDAHVTELVVDRGLLHGAKVIPLGQVQDVRAGEVHLTLDREQFERANGFADQRYRYPHRTWAPPQGFLPTDCLFDVAAYGAGPSSALGALPGDLPATPPDPRPNLLRPVVSEGTPVLSADGKKVGEIASISFHPDDGRLVSAVMKWGLLEHERLELPREWIADLDDKGLSLNVNSDQVHQHRS